MAPTFNEFTGRPIVTGYHKHPSACSYNVKCQVCTDNFIDAGKKTGERDAIVKVSELEALATIKDHVTSISLDYTALRDIIAAKGDRILSQWTGSSVKRRKTLLVQAMGELPKQKWAHLYAYMDSGSRIPTASYREPFRQYFLLPYMTRKAFLQDPYRLMQLLFLRSEHDPPQWAWIDHQLTRFGRRSGMLATRFSDTIFSTSLDPSAYGRHEKFDTHLFHAWGQVGFPVAEILFEAQRNLYRTLRKTVDVILGESKDIATADKVWREQGANGFKELAPEDYNGTPIKVPIQPFDHPPQFGLTCMRELVDERLTAVERELWVLQTDLIHATQRVTAIYEGGQVQSLASYQMWTETAFQLTQPLLSRARFWSPFHEYLNMLKYVLMTPERPAEAQSNAEQGVQIRPKVDLALATTHALISRDLEVDLPEILANSAFVEPYFDSIVAPAMRLPKYREGPRCNVFADRWDAHNLNQDKQIFDDNPIFWILSEMRGVGDGINHGILEGVFPILEDIHIAPDRYQVDLTHLQQTQTLAAFADFAAGLSIQSILDAYRPKFRPVTRDDAEAFYNSIAVQIGTQGNLYRGSSSKCWENEDLDENFTKAGKLLEKFYNLAPSAKPQRTYDWISKALVAKAALDEFWAEIRELQIQALLDSKDLGRRLTRAAVKEWRDVRILDYYKETNFVDIRKADLRDLDQAKTTQAANKRRLDEKAEQQRLDDQIIEDTLSSPTKKPKVRDDRKPLEPPKPLKRKHLPTRADPEPPAPIARPPTPPSPAKIPASSASMDLLARMLPNDSGTLDTSGARFSDIVAMMADIGYPGSPAGGSRWRFSGPEGMIVVHAPHGALATEVVRDKLLHFGRQLKERYKWGYERCVERA